MKSKKADFFWPSFTDLMTSLFFIMLVLFVLVYAKQQKQIKDLKEIVDFVKAAQETLQPLKKDTSLFIYEPEYKRFKLSFDVKFRPGKSNIIPSDLEKYSVTVSNIDRAGSKLKTIIDGLKQAKLNNPKLKDVSYIFVIAGYASIDSTGKMYNYELSYKRALSLKNYWLTRKIDFESSEYKDLIDLQLAGNGFGGIGRVENDETDNQRFLIQIYPKIKDIKIK